jgi:hypothetical protein
MQVGHDEQMAVAVGKGIEDDEALFSPEQDEVFCIVAFAGLEAEDAPLIVLIDGGNVLHPPGSP